jgi:hypothetical protein
MKLRELASNLLLSLVAVALTVTTVVLAPLPLMLLRRNGGRKSFLLGALLSGLILFWVVTPGILGVFLVAVILTFVYSECENQNIGYSSSVLVSLLVVCGFTAIAVGIGMQHYGLDPVLFFRGQIDLALTQVSLPAGMKVDKESLVRQIPSALLIILIFSTWMNSVLVRRLEAMLGWSPVKQKHVFVSQDFREWKLPESFVWIALAAAAGAYFEFQPTWGHWVATNIFNIVVLLYFFQGLAVIVDFFVVKQVSSFWRVVAYLFIFSQLFLMVSFLGFVDLWMEFRNRKKTDKSAMA